MNKWLKGAIACACTAMMAAGGVYVGADVQAPPPTIACQVNVL
jgi:hypothetical protein